MAILNIRKKRKYITVPTSTDIQRNLQTDYRDQREQVRRVKNKRQKKQDNYFDRNKKCTCS